MYDGGIDKMSEVVCLEVQFVSESPVASFASRSAHDGVILSCETFLIGIEFGDVHLRVYISVFTLRGSHHCYELVHDLVEALVFRHGIDSRHRLTPFIHVSVMESRSVVFALHLSGSDEEVVPSFSLLALPCLEHRQERRIVEDIKTFFPESAGPCSGAEWSVHHDGMLRVVHIDKPLLLGIERRRQGTEDDE